MQKKYWSDTAPDGTCSLVALAQANALLNDGTYREVPTVYTADRAWMRQQLQALKLCVQEAESSPKWVADMLPSWLHHGLSDEDGDPVNPIDAQYVLIDTLLEMASVLGLNINIWQIMFTELEDGEKGKMEHATKYQLFALVRNGYFHYVYEATVVEWLGWFCVKSVNIMQTLQHYFVHPNLTVNEKLVKTLTLLSDTWTPSQLE